MENSINNNNQFYFSKDDNDKQHVMNSKSDNMEFMISDKTDEIIERLFNSLKNRYQNNSKSMRDSQFVFHYVYLLHYKSHKINLNCGGSYINSPDLIKTKTKKQQ